MIGKREQGGGAWTDPAEPGTVQIKLTSLEKALIGKLMLKI